MGLFRRRRRDLVCREAVALATDYLEGAMSEGERARFEAHLDHCPHCSEHLAQMRVTIETLGHVTPDDLAPDALEELVSLYRRWRAD